MTTKKAEAKPRKACGYREQGNCSNKLTHKIKRYYITSGTSVNRMLSFGEIYIHSEMYQNNSK